MKTLFLISQLPWPLDTGAKIRSFNLIKRLSERHDITLVAFGDSRKEKEKVACLKEYCYEIVVVPKEGGNMHVSALLNIFSTRPFQVDKYYTKRMEETIAGLLAKGRYDLLHCDSVQMSLNVLGVREMGLSQAERVDCPKFPVPIVLTEHNIEFHILKRAAANETNPIKKMYLWLQYVKLKKYETAACGKFDRVVAVSENDKRYIEKESGMNNVSVVPNGVNVDHFLPVHTSGRKKLVFTGSMDWLPNEDAVIYFYKKIFPLILREVPDVSFTIVGRAPSAKIQNLLKNDIRVTLTGRVDDVRPFVGEANIFVVPLRIGGGTRLKILEAMAMGKCVITTPIGCEGLKVKNERNIVIAKTPALFAENVLELINDTVLCDRLGKAGRKLVEEKYDWKQIAVTLDNVWSKASAAAELPILLYHDICDDNFDVSTSAAERRPYILNISDFEKQMKYLRDNGYRTIGLKELPDCGNYPEKEKLVAVVFDDGLVSNHEKALPVLKKYNQKASFFITAGMVGESNMMSWEEIKDLEQAGMTIGSHSMTHSIPAELSEKELSYELKASKELLEKKLGIKIDHFSSPTGYVNERMPVVAKRLGYKGVLFSDPMVNRIGKSYILSKTGIKRGYTFERFVAIVERNAAEYNELRRKHNVRKKLRKVMGPKGYEFLRSAILSDQVRGKIK